jgi:hypothetical protein
MDRPLTDTIMDGELVTDIDPKTNEVSTEVQSTGHEEQSGVSESVHGGRGRDGSTDTTSARPHIHLHITLRIYSETPLRPQATLRFYAFDCLVINGENIMSKPLEKRFGRLKMWIVDPFIKALRDVPEWAGALPFDLIAKKQELSYHIKQVLDVHVPALQHGHDGLIFTCSESAYTPGTDEKM